MNNLIVNRTPLYRILRIILPAAICCAVTGCGIYDTFRSSQYRIDNSAYGDIPISDTTSMGTIRWQDFFHDDALCRLIDTALRNNADLQTAQMKTEEAQAALRSSKLAFLPSFDVSPEVVYDGATTVRLPVNASWEVDLFGSLRNAKRGKLAALLQSDAYAQAVRSQLIATVATTYYSLLALDAQQEIYKETEQSWKQNVEVTRRLMEAGRYNAASLAQTEADYYNVRNNLVDIEQQIRETENRLCSLLGWTPRTIDRGCLKDWTRPEIVSVGVPVRTLANRPDIKQSEYALAETFYSVNMARSALYPSLTISGSYDFRETFYEAIGSLLQPLFQRGSLRANLKIAEAQRQEAEIAFRQSVIDAGIEVNDAFIAVKSSRAKRENCAKQVMYLQNAVTCTQLLMKHGTTTYLEVLAAQEGLLEAQINEVVNSLSEISSTITLYQALGGGAV